MKISGFTIIRNAVRYDFPIVESIRSILDLVDEYIVVAGDSSDATDELIAAIGSPKIRVIKTVWDTSKYKDKGMIYAHQTNIALRACTGDWCFYLQSDEVVHEDALPVIRRACETYLDDPRVEGFLLKYVHLWGDYKHYVDALHFAYPREVRIVRNLPQIHSWRDAQSFRYIPDFDHEDYWQKEGTRKLRCVLLDARLYHYGWSRDPRCMVGKINEQRSMHDPDAAPRASVDYYDYGNLDDMPLFRESHPAVMRERIAACSWHHLLRRSGPSPDIDKKFRLKYRIMTFIENRLLGGRTLGGFKNYTLVKTKR